jgi:quinol monooxygenase YgiN
MMQLTIKFTAPPGGASQLLQALHASMRRVRQCPGCSHVHIAADVDAADAYWYCEDWSDADALKRQITTRHFSQLLALMETCTEEPSVEFRTIERRQGLEFVAALREVSM